MARLRYTGEVEVLFQDLNRGPVKQNEEFDVPDAEKERYTRRDDIEDLDAPPEVEPAPEAPTATESHADAAQVETATPAADTAAPAAE